MSSILQSYSSSVSPRLLLSRCVIGIGVEDEDRLDQWIEDAESVSNK